MRRLSSLPAIAYGLALAVYLAGLLGLWSSGFPAHLRWPGAVIWLLAAGLGLSISHISQALTHWCSLRWLGIPPERAARLAAWLDLPLILLPVGLLLYPWLAAWGQTLQMDVLGHLFPFWRSGPLEMPPAGYLLLLWAGPWLTLTLFLKLIFGARLLLLRLQNGDDRVNVRLPVLFGAAAVFYLLLSCWTTLVYPPTGDEPHYLLMAQSMWQEGDLDLTDNLGRGDFRAYYPAEQLDHHAAPNPSGKLISKHFPLLSWLILPGFMLGGRFGAAVIISLLAAGVAAAVYAFSRGWGGTRAEALWAWLLAVAGVPLAVYFDLIYPEVPAALAVMLGLWGWHHGGMRGVLLTALAAALLPWIYPKYIPLAAVLALLLPVTRGATLFDLGWAVLILALSASGYFLFFQNTYAFTAGQNPYGTWAAPWSPRGLRNALGLLVDRDFGMLATAPALLLAVPGWLRLRRTNLRSAAVVAAVFFTQYLLFTMFEDFSGSAAVFSRQMIPGVVLLLPLLPMGWSAVKAGRRWLAGLLVAGSVVLAWACAAWPMLRYVSPKLLLWEKLGFAPSLFPSLLQQAGWPDYIWAGGWVVAAGLAGWWLSADHSRSR